MSKQTELNLDVLTQLPYQELRHKKHMHVHPMVMLSLFDISTEWEKIANYHYMLKRDDYTITVRYDVNKNQMIFDKVYNNISENISNALLKNNSFT